MYFKEQNILLCAIDHGFSTIKTPHLYLTMELKKLAQKQHWKQRQWSAKTLFIKSEKADFQ